MTEIIEKTELKFMGYKIPVTVDTLFETTRCIGISFVVEDESDYWKPADKERGFRLLMDSGDLIFVVSPQFLTHLNKINSGVKQQISTYLKENLASKNPDSIKNLNVFFDCKCEGTWRFLTVMLDCITDEYERIESVYIHINKPDNQIVDHLIDYIERSEFVSAKEQYLGVLEDIYE